MYLQPGAYLLLDNSPIVHFLVKLQFQYLHKYCNPFSGHCFGDKMKAKAYFVEGKDTPVIASWESQHGHDQVAVPKK